MENRVMKTKTTTLVFAIVVGFAVGFWLYGIGRTMRETVNFNTTALLSGLIFGVALPLAVVLLLLIAFKLCFLERWWPVCLLFVVFAVSLLGGSLASESWILWDEARFSAEVSKANGRNPYSRPRAWPNQGCSLVFVPGMGIHSTD
jgi:hypothetical protein